MAFRATAALEIVDDVGDAPRFQPAARGCIEPWRVPAIHRAAFERAIGAIGTEGILRRMTCAAVAGAIDQICAAIPFRALCRVESECARLEEQRIPAAHDDPMIEWPSQRHRGAGVADCRQCREIGFDRQHVRAGHSREIGIGKRRIVARAVRRDAVVHGAIEIVVAPCADAGVAIWRQVGRIDRAERRLDLAPTGKWLRRIGGVATRAIAGIGQHLALRDDRRRIVARNRCPDRQHRYDDTIAGQQRAHAGGILPDACVDRSGTALRIGFGNYRPPSMRADQRRRGMPIILHCSRTRRRNLCQIGGAGTT